VSLGLIIMFDNDKKKDSDTKGSKQYHILVLGSTYNRHLLVKLRRKIRGRNGARTRDEKVMQF